VTEDPTQIMGRPDLAPDEAAHPLVFARRWRALALLGSGGMGSVYLARDMELGELVALKTVKSSVALDPGAIERFRQEVRLARHVTSPYVARTHDMGEHDGRIFLTMQYIDGEPLSARLRRDGAMHLRAVVRLAHDVAAGLDAVHASGIVHRDLKPGNVMLAKDGTAILTDFGIALGASTAAASDGSGTPTYTAPEQLAGRAVDRRADVFGMGALLYAAATGRRPFQAERTGAEAPPDPREHVPSLPEVFCAVVMRAMAVDPEARFASAGDLYESLASLASASESATASALFDFVRSLTAGVRHIAVGELRARADRAALRDAVRSYMVACLENSGELSESPVNDATEAVLDGAISEAGGDCILDLELRSRDGDAFWRRTFRAPRAALASVVETAARSAGAALAASCSADVTPSFGSAEAAEAFLAARAEYRKLWLVHGKRAMELLDRADALAPNHPSVIAWKAVTQARMRFNEDGHNHARELVTRALELGGAREPEVHLALAQVHIQDMKIVESMRETLIALRLAPGLIDARVALDVLLSEIGAPAPAEKLASALLGAEGAFAGGVSTLVRLAGVRGRFDEIAALAARVPRGSHGAPRVAIELLRQSLWNRRPVLASEFPTPPDPIALGLLAALRAVLAGRPPTGLDALQGALTTTVSPRRRALVAQLTCELHAYRGDDAGFFAGLDRAVALGVFDAVWIEGCPLFDPYHGIVHFEAARRTIHGRALDALVEADRVLTAPLETVLHASVDGAAPR
jgi:hypothetical protein